jgi:hypothetical protein
MVGKAIAGRREGIVLATKVYSPMSDERNHQGGSRRWLVTELDNSLHRVNADAGASRNLGHRYLRARVGECHAGGREDLVAVALGIGTSRRRRGSWLGNQRL